MKRAQIHSPKKDVSKSELINSLTKRHSEDQDKIVHLINEVNRLTEVNLQLNNKVTELQATNDELQATIDELNAQLHKNSQNSSFPPSHDLFSAKSKSPKSRSLREKKYKNPGGQLNHPGKTRELSDNPDVIYENHVDYCTCGNDLHAISPLKTYRRQVIEIPKPQITIIEYRTEQKRCPCCGKIIQSEFPKDVPHTINFGSNLQSTELYLRVAHLLPVERISLMCNDFFSSRISPAQILKLTDSCAELLKDFEEEAKEVILASPIIYCDETGFQMENKRGWLHTCCTSNITLYHPDFQRGSAAMDRFGILPQYTGRVMSDFWSAYDKYASCSHTFCKAHIIRELRGIYENYDEQEWAKKLEALFNEMYVARYISNTINDDLIRKFKEKYDSLVNEGLDKNPEPRPKVIKRGKKKRSKALNLLLRLMSKKDDILVFLDNQEIPYTNNIAEQAVRMMKVQQKISGSFRKESGAVSFCRVREYIETVRKNGKNVKEALCDLVKGKVWSVKDIIS